MFKVHEVRPKSFNAVLVTGSEDDIDGIARWAGGTVSRSNGKFVRMEFWPGVRAAVEGDWLVVNGTGAVTVFTGSDFNALYDFI